MSTSPEIRASKSAIRKLADPNSKVHAVMLYGADEQAMENLASWICQAWLCTNLQKGEACGECAACKTFQKGVSADFLAIAPRPPSNLIRTRAIVPVNPENEDDKLLLPMTEFLRTSALSSQRKVVWIKNPERMVDRASSALLKTLEEPPPYAKIILTTTQIGALPPTVVSRCVTVACEFEERTETQLDSDIGLLVEKLLNSKPEAALKLAEEFRQICGSLGDEEELSARAASTRSLEALAHALARMGAIPDQVQMVAETHRRIQGNAQAPLAVDALFVSLLFPIPRPVISAV